MKSLLRRTIPSTVPRAACGFDKPDLAPNHFLGNTRLSNFKREAIKNIHTKSRSELYYLDFLTMGVVETPGDYMLLSRFPSLCKMQLICFH